MMDMTIGAALHDHPPDFSVKGMAALIGKLPPGDLPAAWFMSLHHDVLAAYRRFDTDAEAWRGRMAELIGIGGLPHRLRFSTLGGDYLVGLIPPQDMTEPPRWWRIDKEGLLIPRKRTRAERDGQVNKLWKQLRDIPRAVDYLPGIPNTLWAPPAGGSMADRGFAVHIRKPAEAVLAFVGFDPDKASQPFVVDGQWTKMKLSTFHLLRERQGVPQPGPEWWRPDL
jgi:hypothetical protein